MGGTAANKRRGGVGAAAFAATIAIAVGGAPAADAGGRTASFKPAEKTERALFFNLRGVRPERIVGAEATLRGGRARSKRVEHRLNPRRVRAIARRGGMLRVRKPRLVRRGRLRVRLEKKPASPAAPASCAFVGVESCTVLAADDGSNPDPTAIWGGDPYCANASRVQQVEGFRRLTVQDGDDSWGERCELANNNRGDTFYVYEEGARAITMMRVRLAESFPLSTDEWTWQTVAQMKQVQPADNGGGTPVLALHAFYGSWRLYRSDSSGPSSIAEEIWATPAKKNVWTQIAFDVTYSRDPSKGKVQLFVDANGDGDAADPGEASPVIETYTLKRETATNAGDGVSDDGIAEGESVPSHLRIGIYHDEAIGCPPPSGCTADYDDVVVAQPN